MDDWMIALRLPFDSAQGRRSGQALRVTIDWMTWPGRQVG